jgi:hypothetical protein
MIIATLNMNCLKSNSKVSGELPDSWKSSTYSLNIVEKSPAEQFFRFYGHITATPPSACAHIGQGDFLGGQDDGPIVRGLRGDGQRFVGCARGRFDDQEVQIASFQVGVELADGRKVLQTAHGG